MVVLYMTVKKNYFTHHLCSLIMALIPYKGRITQHNGLLLTHDINQKPLVTPE